MQGQVLGLLMAHIGSGNSIEILVALETLLGFVEDSPNRKILSEYRAHIHGILDYVHSFEHDHIHKVL